MDTIIITFPKVKVNTEIIFLDIHGNLIYYMF